MSRRVCAAVPAPVVLSLAVLLLAVLLLAGCSATDGPTDREPRSPTPTVAPGFRTIAFHGISLDVPTAARLTPTPSCDPALSPGDVVVAVFDGGSSAAACPAARPDDPPVAARSTTSLTVVLTATGTPSGIAVDGLQEHQITAAGVTVGIAGPGAAVVTVLDSIRVTPQDGHGCAEQIDPTVAPRNIGSADGELLPAPVSRVVVCEYAVTGGGRTHWLVGSRELAGDEADHLVARLDAAPAARPGSPPNGATVPSTADGPVLRLLVLGSDGNTRTLQASTGADPQDVTDGETTVRVAVLVDGWFAPLPTPFDVR